MSILPITLETKQKKTLEISSQDKYIFFQFELFPQYLHIILNDNLFDDAFDTNIELIYIGGR